MYHINIGTKFPFFSIVTGLVKTSTKKLMVDKRTWMNCGKQIVSYRTKNFQAQTERLQVDPDQFSLKKTKTIPSVLISFWTLPSVRQISDQVMEVTEEIVAANHHQKGKKIIRSKISILLLKVIFRFVNKTRTDKDSFNICKVTILLGF